MNRKKAEYYLLHCRMTKEWVITIQDLMKELKESRDFYRKNLLAIKLKEAKNYLKNTQRMVTYLQTGVRPPIGRYCTYRYFREPMKILKLRPEN